MNPLRIAWRYLWHRPLVTLLSMISIALAAGLISGVLTVRREVDRFFLADSALYDLVIGAKGSPLQLVLSSVYHIDIPTGNIPLSTLSHVRKKQTVTTAVPISLGDQIDGFRIVGTDEFIQNLVNRKTKEPILRLIEGEWFENPFTVVVGAEVNRQIGLGMGDEFISAHGLVDTGLSESDCQHAYRVVGRLGPTGTALDQVVLTPLESVWHAHAHGDHDGPEEALEITAILVQMTAPGLRMWLADDLREETEAIAAVPLQEMLRLRLQLIQPITKALVWISSLVVVVSLSGISIGMILTADRRQKDWAILRTLGAKPAQVLGLVAIESLLLVYSGIALGMIFSHGLLAYFAGQLGGQLAGISAWWSVGQTEALLQVLLLGLGLLSALLPAFTAYRKYVS